jgi:hypothetical protein
MDTQKEKDAYSTWFDGYPINIEYSPKAFGWDCWQMGYARAKAEIKTEKSALNAQELNEALAQCKKLIEQVSDGELTIITVRKDDVERAKLGYIND